MPKCIILIGVPCSGKSTFAESLGIPILSCDSIRQELRPGKYKFDSSIEDKVWETFYARVRFLSHNNKDFIIDNTNCRLKYIKQIKENLKSDYEGHFIYFDIPMWKVKVRNIWRWFNTGKWIPVKVLESMYRNYKNINREEYERVFHQ